MPEYQHKSKKKLEKQIDQPVYKLYGLTPEEIKIVEEKNMNDIKDIIKDIHISRIREREKLDKILLTIVVGTLVLSATFVADLVKFQTLVHLNFLFLSWLSLIIALIGIMVGYITVELHFKILEDAFISKYIYDNDNIWRKITDWLNYRCLFLTILGIILLMIFVFINIKHINL